MSTNTIIRPKTREEWLEVRKQGIGSSEVATIVGLNPWETPYQLWRRKVGIDPPKEENFAMKAGHYLEDAVSLFWQDETGQQVIKRSQGDWLIRDNERPYLQVSPDRTFWLRDQPHNAASKGILECKTTQMTIDADDLPKHWFCQVQYQLGVAGYTHGSLAWLTAGREFDYKDIAFVPDFYQWLVEEVDKFWKDNILGCVEPPVTTAADVITKYTRHTPGKIIECSDEVFEAYEKLKKLKAAAKEQDDHKAELEDTIKVGFGDAEALTYGGQTIATWKAPKASKKFDYKRFQTEHPDLCEPYMVETQGARRLLLK